MQVAYEQMKAQLLEQVEKDIDLLSSEFTTSKEQVQKLLQEEMTSTKVSKKRLRKNIDNISSMHSLTDEGSFDSQDLNDKDEVKEDGTPKKDPPKEGDVMAKRMVMIEKQNRQMMRLFSQLHGAPKLQVSLGIATVMQCHRSGKKLQKQHCQRSSIFLT